MNDSIQVGTAADAARPPLWQAMILAAMAGGMGWGIRGQYGHETGAMIAGLLVSLVLVFLFCPTMAALPAARAVAWCTVAIGFGGSMTYGQTIGLTQNPSMIGNWDALGWGMLGLAIKGGLWIGFAGVFLGMGLGGVRYRPLELLCLMLGLLVLFFAGVALLNSPFDPARKVLPRIYFSADWRWEPGAGADLRPRPEVWGGMLSALLGVLFYTGLWRKDRLARNLGLWAILGGAMGFPLGQSLQACHAWNPEAYRHGFLGKLDPFMNWWNMMETTYGAVFGAVLGLGLWLERKRIAAPAEDEAAGARMKPGLEWLLVAAHVTLLVAGEFKFDLIVDVGLAMGIIPIVGIAAGRWWPYLLALPITAIPIAGKTLRQLCYKENTMSPAPGWLLYVALPVAITLVAAIWFARKHTTGVGATDWSARNYTRRALLLAAWLYFGLNFAFFHYPFPWLSWTGRTPNGVLFTIATLGLTAAAVFVGRKRGRGVD